MSNQQQYQAQVTETQYREELCDFACLVDHFGARQVFKDLQVIYPSIWEDIYRAVVDKEGRSVPALFKENYGN